MCSRRAKSAEFRKALDYQCVEFRDEGIGVFAPAPLAFLEVEFEVCAGSVELGQPPFGEGPEALDAIDVDVRAAVGRGDAVLKDHSG